MNNVAILNKYEDVRCELWNTKHILDMKTAKVLDNNTNVSYEAFVDPIGNNMNTVCLYSISDKKQVETVSFDEFNSQRFQIINIKELFN